MRTVKRLLLAIMKISPLVYICMTACSSNDLWNSINNGQGRVGEVTVTSVTSDSGGIAVNWTVPSEYIEHVNIEWTDGSTPGSGSSVSGTYIIESSHITDGSKYTITLIAVNFAGSLSKGVSFEYTWDAGSSGEAWFIYTAEDLNAVRGGVSGYTEWDLADTYYLMADIDLSGFDSGSGTGFDPLGDSGTPFSGFLDGNGHTVGNLNIDLPSGQYVGLFGYISGTVKNIILTGMSVSGYQYTGGLAGYNVGSIEGCSVSGSLTSTGMYAGGLCGYNGGTVSGCSSGGTMASVEYAGGLVGDSSGQIQESFSSCTVTGSAASQFQGGLVGRNTGQIQSNCYATGDVSGESMIGGLVGRNEGPISDSHATGAVYGIDDYVGGLVGRNLYSDSGTLSITNCYSTGTVTGDQYVGGLMGANENSSTGSISLTGCSHSLGNVTASGTWAGGLMGYNGNGGTGSISVNSCHATGNVEGTGYVAGLIGHNNNSSSGSIAISSCSHSGGSVNGSSMYAGGLVGYCYCDPAGSNTISSCTITSTSVTGDQYVGGLIGSLFGYLSLDNSSASTAVSGASDYVGGLIGYFYYAGSADVTFDTCWANGNVSSTGGGYVGGLIGENDNASAYSVAITGCYHASGNVTGASNVGGLIGYNYNGSTGSITVTGSYHELGTVTGTSYTGGLVGSSVKATISSCHSSGLVSCTGLNSGGLVGYNDNGGGGTVYAVIEYCTSSATVDCDGNAGGFWAGTISVPYHIAALQVMFPEAAIRAGLSAIHHPPRE